jgi:hypothetical protein
MEAVLPTGTVGITIGRNVGRTPLAESDWNAFRAQVQEAVNDFVAAIPGGFVTVDGNVGTGFWFEDGERFEEENAVWLVQYQLYFEKAKLAEDEIERVARNQTGAFITLADDIAHVVHAFGQESFALTEGRTGLLEGHEPHIVDIGGEAEAFLAEFENPTDTPDDYEGDRYNGDA